MSKGKKIGFVGGGNMAGAIIGGMLQNKIMLPANTGVFDIVKEKTERLVKKHTIVPMETIEALAEFSDIIMIAVKPNAMPQVLTSLKPVMGQKPVVSIAAAWSADRIKKILGETANVLRIMPNTPLMAGEGMTVFEVPSSLPKDDFDFMEKVFFSMGKVEKQPKALMDAVTAISGSGPAYVYMFIEALADAGVRQGLAEETALTLAAQTVLGAARMVMQSGKHPWQLKEEVCSPGGTTIEAVRVFEEKDLYDIIGLAVQKCAEKSQILSK